MPWTQRIDCPTTIPLSACLSRKTHTHTHHSYAHTHTHIHRMSQAIGKVCAPACRALACTQRMALDSGTLVGHYRDQLLAWDQPRMHKETRLTCRTFLGLTSSELAQRLRGLHRIKIGSAHSRLTSRYSHGSIREPTLPVRTSLSRPQTLGPMQ